MDELRKIFTSMGPRVGYHGPQYNKPFKELTTDQLRSIIRANWFDCTNRPGAVWIDVCVGDNLVVCRVFTLLTS
jgi:hypothetical protein